MNSLLLTYLISKGVQLKQTVSFVNQKDINTLSQKLEPVVNGLIYSKGKFTSKYIKDENRFSKEVLIFNNKDTYDLSLVKDTVLNTPQLNKDYRIMYYVNLKNEIILLNYEPN